MAAIASTVMLMVLPTMVTTLKNTVSASVRWSTAHCQIGWSMTVRPSDSAAPSASPAANAASSASAPIRTGSSRDRAAGRPVLACRASHSASPASSTTATAYGSQT